MVVPRNIRRKATKEERRAEEEGRRERQRCGMPPWKNPDGSIRCEKLASDWTLRQWADDYTASKKVLKEFIYTRDVYGWNTSQLESAITFCIRQAGYTTDVKVSFVVGRQHIIVRPSNRLSRMFPPITSQPCATLERQIKLVWPPRRRYNPRWYNWIPHRA